MNNVVGRTILAQIGSSNMAILRAYSKDLFDSGVSFKIPTGPDGVEAIRIELMPSDTYKVTGFRRGYFSDGKFTQPPHDIVEDVYVEGLATVLGLMSGRELMSLEPV